MLNSLEGRIMNDGKWFKHACGSLISNVKYSRHPSNALGNANKSNATLLLDILPFHAL